MAGDRRDKRILTTEELERQRKEEEDIHEIFTPYTRSQKGKI